MSDYTYTYTDPHGGTIKITSSGLMYADDRVDGVAVELPTGAEAVRLARAILAGTGFEAVDRRPATAFTLSDRDFMELVAFTTKVQFEGFDYASSEYRPRFADADLAAWATDRTNLEALYDLHEEAVEEFWDRPDAEARYDAHIDRGRK